MKKGIAVLSVLLIGLLCACSQPQTVSAAEPSAPVLPQTEKSTEVPEKTAFQYEHDPTENPDAMKDIVVNPDAVYGFSPDPESKRLGVYAEYDWTDPELVENARQQRIAYHEQIEGMLVLLRQMRDEGSTVEEMARAISAERNRIRLEAYTDNPEALEKIRQSNLEKYGNENGPTIESLYEQYGSWENIIQSAFGTNSGMDACTGLYDEYYPLYVELGLVTEPSPAP